MCARRCALSRPSCRLVVRKSVVASSASPGLVLTLLTPLSRLTPVSIAMAFYRNGLAHMDQSPLREIGQKANIRRTVTTSVLTISPPKKAAPGKDQAPTPTVQLMQFQPKQVLEFGEVELGTSQTRNLLLFNPSSGPQGIEFMRPPSAEKGFRTDRVFPAIFPGDSIKIPFHWEPQKEGKIFESVMLTTTDGHRIQVCLTGNCFRKVVKVIRRGPNRRGALAQPPAKSSPGHPIRRMSTYTVAKGPRPSDIGDVGQDAADQQMKRRHDAAVLIQAVWKGFSVRRKVLCRLMAAEQHRLEQERIRLDKVREMAAIRIQSLWRGYVVRKEIARKFEEARLIAIEKQRIEQERIQSAIRIQSFWWGYQVRKLMKRRQAAAFLIQAAWRYHCARQTLIRLVMAAAEQHRLEQERKRVEEMKTAAATKIQSLWRGHRARKQMNSRHEAAIVIQAVWRGYATRQRLFAADQQIKRCHDAALLIQTYWRRYSTRQKLIRLVMAAAEQHRLQQERIRLEEMRTAAAAKIQSLWRGFWTRKQMKYCHDAAIVIQAVWRRYSARQKLIRLVKAAAELHRLEQERIRLEEVKEIAAIRIQSLWRGYVVRKEIALKFEEARLMAIEKQRIEQERIQSAIKIQSLWRGFWTRKLIKRRHDAALVIQTVWRDYSARQKLIRLVMAAAEKHRQQQEQERIRLEEVREMAAIRIQSLWRSYATRKEIARELEEARLIAIEQERIESAIRIQSLWRGYWTRKLMKSRNDAALIIQVAWRGYSARQRQFAAAQQMKRRHEAAIVVQSVWRKYAARQRLLRRLNAAAELQRAEQEVREMSAIKIQSIWRGYRTRKEMFKQNKAIEEAKLRVDENKRNASPSMTLAARTSSALDALLTYKSLQKLSDHLKSLQTSTRMSGACCKAIASPAAIKALLTILKQCNRSEPVKQLTCQALDVLINLAKNDETRPALLGTANFVADIIDRAKVFNNSDAIVVRVLTIVWILIMKDSVRLQVEVKRNLIWILDGIKRKADIGRVKLPAVVKTEFKPYWLSHKRSAQHFQTKFDAYVAFTTIKI